jgi:hypothetical protein
MKITCNKIVLHLTLHVWIVGELGRITVCCHDFVWTLSKEPRLQNPQLLPMINLSNNLRLWNSSGSLPKIEFFRPWTFSYYSVNSFLQDMYNISNQATSRYETSHVIVILTKVTLWSFSKITGSLWFRQIHCRSKHANS